MRRASLVTGSLLTLFVGSAPCFGACGGMIIVDDAADASTTSVDAATVKSDAGQAAPAPAPPPKKHERPRDAGAEPNCNGPVTFLTCPGGAPQIDTTCGSSASAFHVSDCPGEYSGGGDVCPASLRCSEASDAGWLAAMTVHGSLVDCQGAPLANTEVWTDGLVSFNPTTPCRATTTTDANGRFELNIPGGWSVDYSWGPLQLWVEAAQGPRYVYIDDPSGCPVSACGIVVP